MSLSDSDTEILIGALLLCESMTQKQKRRHTVEKRNMLQKRAISLEPGLLRELRENNPEDFKSYVRMTNENFQQLLQKVSQRMRMQDTSMETAITVEERLSVTLRFLATGRSYEDLTLSSSISAQMLEKMIPETCNAIIDSLLTEYMKFPKTPGEWKAVATQFADMWQFPNCGGALDGMHVRIHPPHNSGSYFNNHKGFFSIILLALVNAKCEFLMVDVGKNGRMSGGLLEHSVFGNKLKYNSLGLLTNEETVGGLNFVFVSDKSFALWEHLLKPFPLGALTQEHNIFNYRLTRARRVVENTFGIMTQRFRVFQTPINLAPETVDRIVLACCVLHNFLRRQNGAAYMPGNELDQEDLINGVVIPGAWRSEATLTGIQPVVPSRATAKAQDNREKYVEYFNGIGAVSWQDDMVSSTV